MEKSQSRQSGFKTTIGGQALIEGVMMKGPTTTAMAVRKPDGEIFTEEWSSNKKSIPWYKKTPFFRGSFNFIDMMLLGYKTLMKSADIAGMDMEDESKFEKWLKEKMGEKAATVISVITLIISLIISVGLFIVLPTFLTSLLRGVTDSILLLTATEAIAKIGIFVLYLFAVSRLEDIKRVFMYHGAEHKTIACYEAGEELTVENVRKYRRFHPRCGTSFLLIVLVVSVLVFSIVTWSNPFIRIVLKVALLPIVVGIAYEIIRFAGKHDNAFTRIISAPGLWLQNLTTYEPQDEMIEVAIASMIPCIPVEKGVDEWN